MSLTLAMLYLTNKSSDYTGNHTKLSKILLNGNNICMVRDSFYGIGCTEANSTPS